VKHLTVKSCEVTIVTWNQSCWGMFSFIAEALTKHWKTKMESYPGA